MLCLLFGLTCKDALDLIPPSVQILSPLDGARMFGQVHVVVVATDAHLKQILAYLDGNLIGQGTSETLSCTCNLPDSLTHTIQAKATDYRGNFGLASVTVNPVSDVEVSSTPVGAEVWLDGIDTGDSTNCVLRKVGTGAHSIVLTKHGYLNWEETLTVHYKQKVNVVATLTANVGAIQVNSNPTGATVWLDGQSTSENTNCLLSDVPAGLHTLKLTLTDYWDWLDTVTVNLGATATREATLTSSPYPDSVVDTIGLDDSPVALAWNATGNRLYCATYEDNSVSIIDCLTNVVITTVGVGTNPRALTWNATNNRIYSANGGSNNVTVIDGASNAYVTTISVGEAPKALTWDGTDNKVYVANSGDSTLTVIDGATDQVLRTITVGDDYPNALEWSRADDRVYCACGNGLVVINGANDQLEPEIELVASSLAWYENADILYCGAYGSVTAVDCKNDGIVTTISSGLSEDLTSVVCDQINGKIYCGHSYLSQALEIIDCNSNSVVRTLDGLSSYTLGLAFNYIQNRVYVCQEGEDIADVLVLGAPQ